MKQTSRLLRAGLASMLLVLLWAAVGRAAHGLPPVRPAFKAGELILYCKPGTAQADVQALANAVKATSVMALRLADCYKLTLPAANQNNAATLAAVAALKPDPRVRWIGPNRLRYPTQTPKTFIPNDPLYTQQWALPFINMPQAWAILPPLANSLSLNVAVVDSGFDKKHPDLVVPNGTPTSRYLDQSYDFANNTSDVTPNGPGIEQQHGVFTSGIIVANTNNNIGVAGVCFSNVDCLGMKVQDVGQDFLDGVAIINSMQYILDNKDKLKLAVVNMSYGGPGDPSDLNDPEYVATKACFDKGLVMVASAGNDAADNHLTTPAAWPFCVTVSALSRASTLASYSSFGKVDIAAPGGDFTSAGDVDQVLSTFNGGYGSFSGTSASAPFVSGVAMLLMTLHGVGDLPPVQARDKVISTLEQTAFHRSDVVPGPIPGPNFGWGFLDAYAAVLKLSANVLVENPAGVDAEGNTTDPTGIAPPIQTQRPILRASVANIPFDPQFLTITLDGTTTLPLTDFTVESGSTTGTNPSYTLVFNDYAKSLFPSGGLPEGEHYLTVTGTNPTTGQQASDVRRFTVTLHQVQTGLSTLSIPYYETAADSPAGNGQIRPLDQVLGTNVTLFRYDPANPAGYDVYSDTATGSTILPLSKALTPTDVAPPSPSTPGAAATPPLGYGYFIKSSTTTKVNTFGQALTETATTDVPFNIPVHEGWNLIGDPFPFAVGFNSLSFLTASNQTLTIQQAADQNLILPYIYRFLGNDYQFQALPNGILAPWEAMWIFVVPKNAKSLNLNTVGSLVVPPTAAAVSLGKSATLTRATGLFDHTLHTASLTRQVPVTVAATNADGTPRVSGPGSWAIRLTAHANNLSDSSNFVGMSVNGRDGVDSTKVPKPPKPSPFVAVGITRAEAPTTLFAQDLRPLGGTKSWTLNVTTDQANSDVTLNWQNLVPVPRNYRLTLLDTTTNQTIDLRTQSAYQFHTGNTAGTRSFVLTARPVSAAGRALLTNIFVNPGRTDGRSPAVYQIGYTASQEANVDVSILTFSGRLLATVGGTRAATSGNNQITWTGRDNAGRAVPAGTYVLQLRAITQDGLVTRETRPLIITGR